MPALGTLLAMLFIVVPGVHAQATPEALAPAECEVTLPNGAGPEFGITLEDRQPATPHQDTWYRDNGLYARVTPDGVVEADLDPDQGGGWFTTMWAHDARPSGMYPALELAVTRVGESTINVPPEVKTPTFGVIGRVQTAGVWVPEGGCWEITATATDLNTSARTQLTIRVWVTIPALEPMLV